MKSISDMVWPMLSHGAVIGIDIGTSSAKAVLVDGDGTIRATATRAHEVSRPAPLVVDGEIDF